MVQKKKIVGEDSSDFEPDEPITPCKKGRGGKKAKANSKAKNSKPDTGEKESEPTLTPSTRRSLRIQTLKKKEPDPDFDVSSEEESGEMSSEVDLPTEEDSDDDDFKPHQGRNRRRQAALKSKILLFVQECLGFCIKCHGVIFPTLTNFPVFIAFKTSMFVLVNFNFASCLVVLLSVLFNSARFEIVTDCE